MESLPPKHKNLSQSSEGQQQSQKTKWDLFKDELKQQTPQQMLEQIRKKIQQPKGKSPFSSLSAKTGSQVTEKKLEIAQDIINQFIKLSDSQSNRNIIGKIFDNIPKQESFYKAEDDVFKILKQYYEVKIDNMSCFAEDHFQLLIGLQLLKEDQELVAEYSISRDQYKNDVPKNNGNERGDIIIRYQNKDVYKIELKIVQKEQFDGQKLKFPSDWGEVSTIEKIEDFLDFTLLQAMSCRNYQSNTDIDSAIPIAMIWIDGFVFCKSSKEKILPKPSNISDKSINAQQSLRQTLLELEKAKKELEICIDDVKNTLIDLNGIETKYRSVVSGSDWKWFLQSVKDSQKTCSAETKVQTIKQIAKNTTNEINKLTEELKQLFMNK